MTYIGAHQHDQGCVRATKVRGGRSPNLRTCASFLFFFTSMIVCLQVALRSDRRSDILDWPLLFESRIEPVTCPIAFCAQLEATLTGTPSSILELLVDQDRVVLALRHAISGMPACRDAARTALKPTFADVTDSGTFSKVGFGSGFAFCAQKRWKLNYAQRKEAREGSGCAKSFNASHGNTYGTLVGLCGCGCIQGSCTVVKAEGCKDIHTFLRRHVLAPIRTSDCAS